MSATATPPVARASAAVSAGTMQAIVQRRYGSVPEEVLHLERLPVPTPAAGEVLVRVRAAGVGRGTCHLMEGMPCVMRLIGFGLRGPKTPVVGLHLAGTIEALGPDVRDLDVGGAVFGLGRGAFAEFATARADAITAMPSNLDFEAAAAVPDSGVTALQAVRDHGRVHAGQRVVVVGASGGVGSFAVQIAKALGAEVTGVCSTSKMDVVRQAGADHVVDYLREDVTDGRQRYDVIIDIGGNRPIHTLRRALTPRGTLVITGGENGGRWLGGTERNARAQLLSPFVAQRLVAFVARPRRDDLVFLRELIESGAVTPIVERSYPLSEVAAAVRHVAEARARGKVVVRI